MLCAGLARPQFTRGSLKPQYLRMWRLHLEAELLESWMIKVKRGRTGGPSSNLLVP